MANRKDTDENGTPLVRTSILVKPETDEALRRLAARGKRPLSWEIRHALETYVAERERAVAA